MRNITTPAVVCELLAYVNANPSASDSVAGIERWWLNTSEGVDMPTLKNALDYLVGRGAFSERIAADGRRRYRRTCSDSELESLLAELQRRPSAGDDNAADGDR
jgi:hypothetical protein